MASDGSRLIDLVAKHGDDDAADLMILLFGGSRVSLPGRMTADHWLVSLVGFEAAKAIVEEMNFGGCGGLVELPIAENSSAEKNRREVYRRLRLGQSIDRIAREVGIHRRTVFRHRAALKRLARKNAASRTEGPSSC